MNKVANKFLLTGYNLLPELRLRQPGFIYSAGKLFTKIRQFREI